MSPDGSLAVRDGTERIASIEPGWSAKGWTALEIAASRRPPTGTPGRVLEIKGGGTLTCLVSAVQAGDAVTITYVVTTTATLAMESVHASVFLPVDQWTGAAYSLAGAPDRTGVIPATFTGDVMVASGTSAALALGPSTQANGIALKFRLDAARPILLQDSRKWSGGLEIRFHDTHPGGAPWSWTPGLTQNIRFTVEANRPLHLAVDAPVTIRAGADWTPLRAHPDVEPGSALDWSDQRLSRSPAGALGWLRTSTVDPGHFEFTAEPGRPIRFYGTNLGLSACFPPHADADRLADRLKRRGYTAIRIHHYEMAPWSRDNGLLDSHASDTLTFNKDHLERFDYFVAALKKRGIYITTDLYVSRPVKANEVYPGAKGDLDYGFKHLLLVNDRARENWKAYARGLLTHVNPYTGLAYRDDPVLATLVLVNEGNPANNLDELRADPREGALWDAAFAAWKTNERATGEWGSANCQRFIWETEARVEQELVAYLKHDLKVKALVTDLNGWTDTWGAQACRTGLDYVDNHMYWDHPRFIEKDWELPTRGSSGGGSAIRAGGAGLGLALTRLMDRPFTVSEFNFVPPNPFRSEAGLLYGAFAALQDWSGMYRFSYAGSPEQAARPGPISFFDIVDDPVAQAEEYAVAALFTRGDLPPAPGAAIIAAPVAEWRQQSDRHVASPLTRLAWAARLGSVGRAATAQELSTGLDATADTATRYLAGLKERGWLQANNATDLTQGILEGPARSVKLETHAGVLTISTPATQGVAGPAGTERTAGALTVSLRRAFAAVWITALDEDALTTSRRMLLVHLTDVKNTGDRFRGLDMQVLEAWGTLPYLAHAGEASIQLERPDAAALTVWRLDGSGHRVAKMASTVRNGSLVFTASTATSPEATFFYEIIKHK